MAGQRPISTMLQLLSCILMWFIIAGVSAADIPLITDYSAFDSVFLPESLEIGSIIGTIRARDPDGTPVTFDILGQGGEYFAVNQTSGVATLKKKMDYEKENEISLIIYVKDGQGQSNSIQTKIFVEDVNDNPPYFTDTAIFRYISELEKPPYVVATLSVKDVDFTNRPIVVTCNRGTLLFQDACDTFILKVINSNVQSWSAQLILNKPVDYEVRQAYNIPFTAFDGVFSVTTEVHVELLDINDTPPQWVSVNPIAIFENESISTFIMQVTATDGDRTSSRPIRYELFGSNTDLFMINSTTGVISNAKILDYDTMGSKKGVPYDISIRAREVINIATGELGNDGNTTSVLTTKITVEDINDEKPTFSQREYVAYVDENIGSGANIPGLQMTITDNDSGTFNSFRLEILNYTDVFGIVPSSDAASSSATIYVVDSKKIDYETGPRQYILDVRAVQNFQNKNTWTGSATVTINVADVNDMSPIFGAPFYNVTIPETASEGTFLIDLDATDPEAGDFGTAGIIYRLYGDSIPPHFQIDQKTGVVTVARCAPPDIPGQAPCIDYERKRNYTLTVSATDNRGMNDSRSRSVQLFIYVIDENDNAPKIDTNYIRYINEGQMVTIDPLLIEVVDPDTVGGPIRFTKKLDQSGLWIVTSTSDTLGRLYGNITAIRPIKYVDAKYPSPEFNFQVEVTDTKATSTANIKIIVIDINDNAPEFTQNQFIVNIPETTPGDVYVTQVTASDIDAPTTGNGVIDFSIQGGAQGKFILTNITLKGTYYVADVYTTKDAIFNFDTQKVYNMTLIAKDRGSPESKSGTTLLVVYIEDKNDKDPHIQPSFQSVSVYENEPVGKTIYKVTANDPDIASILKFYMTPKSATNSAGENVTASSYDFTKLFRIEPDTGFVVISERLDRDKTSRITNDLLVQDVSADPIQSGVGTLLIHILEYNDQPPYFDSPFYNISLLEERSINSFVENLNCKDSDDTIASYSITQTKPDRPNYFALLPGSGNLIVNDRIDFEHIQQIELTATCIDSGQPPLSNTVKVVVNIININDNPPVFSQDMYRISVLENTKGGKLGVTVNAKDEDKGDYGVVNFRLDDKYGFFAIDTIVEANSSRGEITILPNATFDRESATFLVFSVIAYDSPLNESVRLNSSVPVYVTILDVNDNCPVFTQAKYEGKVPQSANNETDVVDIIARDLDEGVNGEIIYAIKTGSGSPPVAEQFFRINPATGRVYMTASQNKTVGFYTLNVTATNKEPYYPGIVCAAEVLVEIEVQQTDNNAPEWISPPDPNFIIYVLESQYEGMIIYNAKARDVDAGPNGVIDYFFTVNGLEPVSSTPEFSINRVTGVIRAEVIYDKETTDKYFLTLLARDRGRPAASSEITIIVVILDVNDNYPVFPMKDGYIIPFTLLPVTEGVMPENGYLGQCKATDADTDVENNRIYYDLFAASDEVRKCILVERDTCKIYLRQPVDYETLSSLEFDIYAYNEKNDASVKRQKREVNPSILPVRGSVKDLNDIPPTFTQTEYLGCVSVDAPFQQDILEVSARDRDVGDNTRITYSLVGTSAFQIDRNLGIIRNNISFREASGDQQIFRFNVLASDGTSSSTAAVTIFVTSSSNTARLKVNRPLAEVLPFKQQLVRTMIDSSNGQIVFACVSDMKNNVDDNGLENAMATDVLMSAFKLVNGQYVAYSATDLVAYVDDARKRDPQFNSIYVTGAKAEGKNDEFILKEDAVLAVLIISILLIFLALLLLCIACICIRSYDRKSKKNIRAASHKIVHVEQPVETSFNPVYNYGQPGSDAGTDEYSTVKKSTPLSFVNPMVIPAPDEPEDIYPVEPPRAYLHDPEPVIETFVEPDPVVKTFAASDPVYETTIEPEPVFETIVEPETVVRTSFVEPVHVAGRQFEPEFEGRIDSDNDEPGEAHRHVSFPVSHHDDDESSHGGGERVTYIRGSPYPSPPASLIHDQPDNDSD